MIDLGDIIGGYRIVSLIGTGGMGRVYEVEHVVTKRVEAMKLLLPGAEGTSPEDQQEQVSRFLREIQVQASLAHPNIAAVHNAFVEAGLLVMVMELVRGSSLKRLLTLEPPPMAKAVDYVIQVLHALEYAHRRGVIHRDITPANVIVQGDGTAKLMDFGLAKSERDIQITREGVAVGSVHYMSPEQVRGQHELDYRSDLYSTGAVLYELISKQKVFDGTDGFAIMRAHVEKQPEPLTNWNKECPAELDVVVRKALAKDPIQRYRSAAEFRNALEKVKAILDATPSSSAKKEPSLEHSIVNVSNAKVGIKPRPTRAAIIAVVALTGLISMSITMYLTGSLLPEAEQSTEAAEPEPEPEAKKAPAKRSNIKRGPTKKAVQPKAEEDSPEWAR